jgi:geranylgeranyl diphosphate synthase type II
MLTVKEITDIINKAASDATLFASPPRSLFEPVEYMLSIGGKRLRPLLTLLLCDILQADLQKALKPALALEVFHNFTIMHDDLMDCADKRRNMPTVHRKWNANTAILSGDAMLIAAYRILGETSPEYDIAQLFHLFSATANDVCCGQQYDMEFETRSTVDEDEYLQMIHLKTGSLIAASLAFGAILGRAPEADCRLFHSFGNFVGMAFQLRDDLLDVYGNTNVFGKNIGGDIVADKKTFLLIKALEQADARQLQAMKRFSHTPGMEFGKEEKIATYKAIYDELGIKEITQQRINELYGKGLECLKQVECVSMQGLKPLTDYTDNLLLRES